MVSAKEDVIGDSSFFLCFLDDISDVQPLLKIFNSGKFEFIVGDVVESEITKSPNYRHIESDFNKVRKRPLGYNYGEIVRMFLGFREITKGEHEVIGIAIVYHVMGRSFLLIIDDEGARKLLEKRASGLKPNLTGTVGFISLCYKKYQIFSVLEAVSILNRIKGSKFRVRPEIVDKVIADLEGCGMYEDSN